MERYTAEQIEQARQEIKRAVMVRFGGHMGPALVGVTVQDEDAIRYLDGATIDQLLEG
jgi:hypothetical protein